MLGWWKCLWDRVNSIQDLYEGNAGIRARVRWNYTMAAGMMIMVLIFVPSTALLALLWHPAFLILAFLAFIIGGAFTTYYLAEVFRGVSPDKEVK